MQRRPRLLALAAALLGAAVCASPAFAQGSGEGARPVAARDTMVVVDVQRLLQQSLANQSIQRQLASQREILQREMAAQYEQQRQAEQELARLRPSLQPDEFDRKRIEFGNEVTATSRVTQEKTRKLDAAFLQARTTMLETIRVVIGEIAAERGATLVISSEFVFYQANDSLDITDTALQRLNTRLPEVKVNLPQ